MAAKPGHTALGPPLKPAKKWGSTNPVMMRTSASTYWRCNRIGVPSTSPTATWRVALGIVVDDGVAGHDVGADELRHLGRRGLAVRPGGAEQGDGGVGNPALLEVRQQRREHGPVGHRPGEIRKHDGDPWRSANGRTGATTDQPRRRADQAA